MQVLILASIFQGTGRQIIALIILKIKLVMASQLTVDGRQASQLV